jgi:DNA-binding CsgD family transcriptional regulator
MEAEMTTFATVPIGIPAASKDIVDAVASLGKARFYRSLLGLLERFAPGHPAQVMHYSRHVAPRYVCSTLTPDAHQAMYVERYYRFDPFYHYMFDQQSGGYARLGELPKAHADVGDYFRVFYSLTKMRDELALLLPTLGGGFVGLFVQSARDFSNEEIEGFKGLYPLCKALHDAQNRLLILSARGGTGDNDLFRALAIFDAKGNEMFRTGDRAALAETEPDLNAGLMALAKQTSGATRRLAHGTLQIEDLGDALPLTPYGRLCFYETGAQLRPPAILGKAINEFIAAHHLTPRQSDILGLALRGHPTAEIARKLGLTEGTVRNHRKEIYAKMDVTTEREIFAMLMAYLFAD